MTTITLSHPGQTPFLVVRGEVCETLREPVLALVEDLEAEGIKTQLEVVESVDVRLLCDLLGLRLVPTIKGGPSLRTEREERCASS